MTERLTGPNPDSTASRTPAQPDRTTAELPDGADIIWTSPFTGYTSYSLVSIPQGVPFQVEYLRQNAGLSFLMSPDEENPDNWTLNGSINPDIVELLGFPVEAKRRRQTAPVLGDKTIEALRAHGNVDATSLQILDVSLSVPKGRIKYLLSGVWQPEKFRNAKRVPFLLDPDSSGRRVLPQKFPRARDSMRQTTLKITSPPPPRIQR